MLHHTLATLAFFPNQLATTSACLGFGINFNQLPSFRLFTYVALSQKKMQPMPSTFQHTSIYYFSMCRLVVQLERHTSQLVRKTQ